MHCFSDITELADFHHVCLFLVTCLSASEWYKRRQNSSQEPAARRCRRGEGGGGAFQPRRPQCGCRLLPLQRQPGRRSSGTVASFYLFPLFAASGTGLQLPSRPPWPSSVLFFPVPCLDHSLSPLTYRVTKRLDFCAFSLTLFFFFFFPSSTVSPGEVFLRPCLHLP